MRFGQPLLVCLDEIRPASHQRLNAEGAVACIRAGNVEASSALRGFRSPVLLPSAKTVEEVNAVEVRVGESTSLTRPSKPWDETLLTLRCSRAQRVDGTSKQRSDAKSQPSVTGESRVDQARETSYASLCRPTSRPVAVVAVPGLPVGRAAAPGALFHERYVWSPSFLFKSCGVSGWFAIMEDKKAYLGLRRWVAVNNAPRRIQMPPTTM
jgi:hypothetical protein